MSTRTRDLILDLAADLFRDKGYAGFSYQHLSKALGLKNAAIHYHFPTKADLGVGIIVRARERFHAWVNSPEIQSLSPDRRLEESFRFLYEQNIRQGLRVCLVGNAAVSFHLISREMKEEVAGMMEDIVAWFTSILEAGRVRQLFRFSGPASARAELIAASLAGALQFSRIAGETHFYTIVNQIKTDIIV